MPVWLWSAGSKTMAKGCLVVDEVETRLDVKLKCVEKELKAPCVVQFLISALGACWGYLGRSDQSKSIFLVA